MPAQQLVIEIGGVTIRAELLDTPTAKALLGAAPFTSTASTWGEEVYFGTPVSLPRERDGRDVVTPGELAFWCDGDSIAIAYGRTPISRGGESRLASPCNVWGKALDDVRQLASVKAGARVTVRPA
jgi:hypothetical protein